MLYILVFGHEVCGILGMQDLSSLTRDQTHTPCSGRENLNHWTTRKVMPPPHLYLILNSQNLVLWKLLQWIVQTVFSLSSCPNIENWDLYFHVFLTYGEQVRMSYCNIYSTWSGGLWPWIAVSVNKWAITMPSLSKDNSWLWIKEEFWWNFRELIYPPHSPSGVS